MTLGARRWAGSRGPVLLACAVVVVLALYTSARKGIWVDEAFSLDTAGRTLAGAFRQATHFELQPPVYFLLLHGWLKLNGSIEFARLLSTLAILASLWVLDALGRLLAISRHRTSLPLLAALCPMVLWAASEARVYALVFLLAAVSTYLFVRVWVVGTERPLRDCALYVASAYVLLLTFYYAGFLLAAHLLAGILFGTRRRSLVRSFLALGVLLLPWAPLILWQAAQHPDYNRPLSFAAASWWGSVVTFGAWLRDMVEHLLFRHAPFVARPDMFVAMGLLALAIVGARLRGARRWSRAESAFAIMVAVPLSILVLLRVAHWSLVELRYYIIVTGALLVLVALVIDRIPSAGAGRLLGALVMGLFALGTLSYERNYRMPQDWRAAAAFVREYARPGEPVVVFDPFGVLPLRYYYHGPNPVHGLPDDPVMTAPYGPFPTDMHGLRDRLASVVGQRRSFWLITHGMLDRPTAVLLERLIADRFTVLRTRWVAGVRVRQLGVPADFSGTDAGGASESTAAIASRMRGAASPAP